MFTRAWGVKKPFDPTDTEMVCPSVRFPLGVTLRVGAGLFAPASVDATAPAAPDSMSATETIHTVRTRMVLGASFTSVGSSSTR
jgi:hypothetical protein